MLYTAHWRVLFFKTTTRTSDTGDRQANISSTKKKKIVVKSKYTVRNFHYFIYFSKWPEISILSYPNYRTQRMGSRDYTVVISHD